MTVVSHADRPDLWDRVPDLFAGVWPEYNLHGDVMAGYWKRLHRVFGRYQLALTGPDDDVLAVARGIPIPWDGTAAGLGSGIDAAIRAGFVCWENGGTPDALCALGIEVAPRHRRRGLAAVMLAALRDTARADGLAHVVVPVRPTGKDRYPLTPIHRYAAWTTPSGEAFDPWIRTHLTCGGRLSAPAPRSSLITGTVRDWETWTEMSFPDTGDYVFPFGQATVHIDREADRGTYWEPNVWVVHEVPR
ncbi:GNAT family N-acetyltransferase [Catenuloplanes japonicus]|uniref:GNAT family N-acetyltransferase n=1 Tax=Catenuloplanes japonicus TaxID=33876 RepID=UPI0005260058|nr:GNAT family N-acetyltransferase [Catenuloplanes japonicus]